MINTQLNCINTDEKYFLLQIFIRLNTCSTLYVYISLHTFFILKMHQTSLKLQNVKKMSYFVQDLDLGYFRPTGAKSASLESTVVKCSHH